MKSFTPALVRFIKEEDGAQVVEYALIIAVVSIGLISVFGSQDGGVKSFVGAMVTRIGNCMSGGTC